MFTYNYTYRGGHDAVVGIRGLLRKIGQDKKDNDNSGGGEGR